MLMCPWFQAEENPALLGEKLPPFRPINFSQIKIKSKHITKDRHTHREARQHWIRLADKAFRTIPQQGLLTLELPER